MIVSDTYCARIYYWYEDANDIYFLRKSLVRLLRWLVSILLLSRTLCDILEVRSDNNGIEISERLILGSKIWRGMPMQIKSLTMKMLKEKNWEKNCCSRTLFWPQATIFTSKASCKIILFQKSSTSLKKCSVAICRLYKSLDCFWSGKPIDTDPIKVGINAGMFQRLGIQLHDFGMIVDQLWLKESVRMNWRFQLTATRPQSPEILYIPHLRYVISRLHVRSRHYMHKLTHPTSLGSLCSVSGRVWIVSISCKLPIKISVISRSPTKAMLCGWHRKCRKIISPQSGFLTRGWRMTETPRVCSQIVAASLPGSSILPAELDTMAILSVPKTLLHSSHARVKEGYILVSLWAVKTYKGCWRIKWSALFHTPKQHKLALSLSKQMAWMPFSFNLLKFIYRMSGHDMLGMRR